MPISVPAGHVALVLLEIGDSSFYLEIPLDVIRSLCLKPRKYLLFLGWCIFGVEGTLARTRRGHELTTDGTLVDGGIYHFLMKGGLSMFSFIIPLLHAGYYLFNEDLAFAVDLEVIKTRTNVLTSCNKTPSQKSQ